MSDLPSAIPTRARSRRPTPTLADPVAWRFDAQVTSTYEVDLAQVERLLPPGRRALEVRPGVGLILVGAQRAPAGNLGHLGPFFEFDWTLAVEREVWPGVPHATFAFSQGRLYSEEIGFVDHASRVDRLDIHHAPSLRVAFDEDRLGVEVWDDQGPIWSVTSAHEGKPVFAKRKYWGQQVTAGPHGAWAQVWTWAGEVFQHQQGYGKPTAVLHPHPVWAGLDVRGMGTRTYEQMLARPGAPIEMVFHRPVRVD